MLETFNSEMQKSKTAFKVVSPGPSHLIAGPYPLLIKAVRGAEFFRGWYGGRKAGMSYAQMIGSSIGYKSAKRIARPLRAQIVAAHRHIPTIEHDFSRKNGIGGRTWITKPGMHEMVIVFHDANRAGPHIDVHIGRLSMVYRVKPDTYAKLKYNSQGYLTQSSKDLLIDHVRSEIANGSRVPQNIDHSMSNARSTWVKGDTTARHYGSGATRQIISTSQVDVFKAHHDGPIELYAPEINSDRPLYLYKMHPGDAKRAPILIWGEKTYNPPKMEERLHLKLVHPEDIDQLNVRADMSTSTAKYDGSSCYFKIGPKGTTIWSPRTSKLHGNQIEYTHKLRGIQDIHSPSTVVGMGEIVFIKKTKWYHRERGNVYLPQAQGSGLLNSNKPLPRNVRPEIRIYRIDKVGNRKFTNTDFWSNRAEQERVAGLNPNTLKVVELMDPSSARQNGFEGVVVVPEGASVNDGFKVKWWTDPHDWVIDKVSFKPGPSGKVAGVIEATSLESGKKFNLGPGQVGNETLTRDMMAHPHRYEGGVIKVQSRHGHEGRASKLLSFHDDIGVSVYD